MAIEPNRNVYVGHRYVPKIMGEWDNTQKYEGLSIVLHEGTSYTSKGYVPVGVDILNEDYWAVTGNYNAQVEHYRQDVAGVKETLTDKADTSFVNTELDKKADTSFVNMELDKKADTSFVNTELDKKGDKTDVDLLKSRVYHLESYGGKGDGVTNSFPAFMSALSDIKENGGSGTIELINGTYLMQPTTSTTTNNKPIDISEIDNFVLTSNSNNAIFKLGEGLKHSDFIYSQNPDQSVTVKNVIFDANAINNPMETGTDPNPREQAQRLFGIYAKNMIFEGNTFKDFYGVNLIIANRHNEASGLSITKFNGNYVENFGKDYSGSVHDTSAFYSHANSFTEDQHVAICTNNTFIADHSTTVTNAFSAVELGAKNIIATDNVINGFHCGIITAHQYVTENMVISDNIINRCARGIFPWAYHVTQSTEAIKNAVIKDNSIFIDSSYWASRGVYTSYEPDGSGQYTHNYTGVGFHPGIARDINNLTIEDNLIYHRLSSARVNETYSAIMIDQLSIPDDKDDLLYGNVSITNNRILNAPNTAISVIGKHIKGLKIMDNEIILPLNKKTSARNVIFIRGRETYSELEDFSIKNNIIDLTNATTGVTIQTDGTVDYLNFYNNEWMNEDNPELIKQINLTVINEVKNATVNEKFNTRKDGVFVDLKENVQLNYCHAWTPDGVLDETGRITYYIDTPNDLPSRVYYIGDEVIIKYPVSGGYKGYVCFVAGNKGGWNGYGLVDETRIDL